MNELIEILEENALSVFTAEKGLDPYIRLIKAELKNFEPSLRNKTTRAEIASKAAKVGKMKIYLDGEGKKLNERLKAQPKIIDAERKRCKDVLQAFQDEVRKPLTDWEDNERVRIDLIKSRILRMENIPQVEVGSELLKAHLTKLEITVIDDSFSEFKGDAAIAKDRAIIDTRQLIDAATTIENEKAELERLRKEAADQQQKEREEKLVKDAEERVKAEAQSKIDAANKSEEAAKAESERLKQKAIDDAVVVEPVKEDPRVLIRSPADGLKEAIAFAGHPGTNSNALANAAASHKESIHGDIVLSLVKCGFDITTANHFMDKLIAGKIDNVTINY
tara:strand:+ start:4178 stop:5182 length:1005 start_codon:yes stop_codon:yes gene_type:complete